MRKKSTRLLSAALAVCMMLSVLPVGAFAAEPGTEPENAATAQEETKGYYLKDGGVTINDDFIAAHGNTYTIGGEETYQHPITIKTNQDVTIKFINNVNYEWQAYFDYWLEHQRSFINAEKVGKLIISNEDNYTFNSRWRGVRFLGVTAPNATVEVNGGSYSADASGVFYFNGCNATLTDVTVDESYTCVYNDHATVTIDRGSYTTVRPAAAIENASDGTLNLKNVTAGGVGGAVRNEGGNVTIYSGRYTNGIVNEYVPVYGYDAKMTILDGEFETEYENDAAIYSSTRFENVDHGWLEIKGGTFTANKDGSSGIIAKTGVSRIENATIKGCQYGIRFESPQVTLKSAEFEDNEIDLCQKEVYKDNQLICPQIQIEDSFDLNKTLTVATVSYSNGDPTGRQFTTATDSHYQKDLKLVSTDPEYIVDYKKNDDGTEFRYFNTREPGKYYVNPIQATMAVGDEEMRPYSQFKPGTEVTLKAFSNDERKKLTGWKVEKIAAPESEVMPNEGIIEYDPENPETATLTVPNYDVFVTAEYADEIVDPGTGDAAAGNIQGALSAVVVGAAAGVIAYEAGTGIYRVINMPGIPMPSNRIELAELLWEHAGKPEPVSTALYSDIDEGDTDAQKAAHWAVEQGLMKDDSEKNTFNPYFPVGKLRTCLTWNAAKEKGLFDKTEE